MTERMELLLRSLLMGLAAAPSQQAVESGLKELVKAQLGYEDVSMSDATKHRHREALDALAREGLNGHAGWIGELLRRGPRGAVRGAGTPWRRALPVLAVLGAAALVGILLRNWPADQTRNEIVKRPPPKESAPEAPLAPKQESPVVRNETGPRAPKGSQQNLPSQKPDGALLVQRVEIGMVLAVTGAPRSSLPEARVSARLKPGAVLYAESRIETGDFDRASIRFLDGTELKLDYDSALSIPKTSPGAKRPESVRLASGSLWAVVATSNDGEKFRVETPVATATVIGTEFGLDLRQTTAGKTEAKLSVRQGKVELSNEFGRSLVGASMVCRVVGGSKPGAPQRLTTSIRVRSSDGFWSTVSTYRFSPWVIGNLLACPTGWIGLTATTEIPKDETIADVPLFDRHGSVRITMVEPGSAAERAGLKWGDRIRAVNGRPVTVALQLIGAIYANLGRPIRLDVERDGRPFSVEVVPELRNYMDHVSLTAEESKRLLWAHQPLFEGNARGTIARLNQLLKTHPSAAVHNDLAVLWLYLDRYDQVEPHAEEAVRLAQNVARYRYTLTWALEFYTGDIERAEEQYEAVVRLNPGNPHYHRASADYYNSYGRPAEGLKHAGRARELDPTLAAAWNAMGNSLSALGRNEEALAAHRKAQELSPNGAGAAGRIAALVGQVDGPKAAEPHLLKSEELGWHFAGPHVDLGQHYQAQGEFDLAEREYRHLLIVDPHYPLGWSRLGALYAQQNRHEDAIRAYEACIKNDPASATGYVGLARQYVLLGEPERAEPLYRRVLEIDPTQSTSLVRLAEILWNRGEHEKAVQELEKSIENFADNTPGLERIGIQLLDWDRPASAERAFRLALPLQKVPRNTAIFWWRIGQVRRAQNDPTGAIEYCRTAIKTFPGLVPAQLELGSLLEERGNFEEAEAAYRGATQAAPRDPSALNALAWHLAERGAKLDEALDLAKRAIAAAPAEAAIADTLGWVLFKCGEFDEADRWLKRSIELYKDSPGAADTWFHLGAVHEAKKEIEKAKGAYRKALSLQPNLKEAAEALKRLGTASKV